MRFKHIIWDYDGTLFDSYPVMAAAFCTELREYGIFEPAGSIISWMSISMGHAIAHYKEQYKLDDVFFERYKVARRKAESENMKPFDGAIELCHAIKGAGGKNYLFTHRGNSVVHLLEKYELLTSFEELITSEQNFPRKPSPEAIIYLINKYGFPKDEAIMVGDREIDILSGENSGIHTCYFLNGSEQSVTADFNIKCLSELYGVLGLDSTF